MTTPADPPPKRVNLRPVRKQNEKQEAGDFLSYQSGFIPTRPPGRVFLFHFTLPQTIRNEESVPEIQVSVTLTLMSPQWKQTLGGVFCSRGHHISCLFTQSFTFHASPSFQFTPVSQQEVTAWKSEPVGAMSTTPPPTAPSDERGRLCFKVPSQRGGKDALSCGEALGANKKAFIPPALCMQDVNRLRDESALRPRSFRIQNQTHLQKKNLWRC